ncbi:hypothetical protein BB561_001146 [Smittium simulii]|uniref:Uncharacterized protein n=1 Tax=Smittium simulii TaxID=133385 RepID=A0A2T9YVV5_9FUNG|nr:hypothetical protein BB561_001146 [Smittium simulii]
MKVSKRRQEEPEENFSDASFDELLQEQPDSPVLEDSDEEYDSQEEREAELERAALLSIKTQRASKQISFEKDAIKALIKELKPLELDWIETCSITSATKLEIKDVSDDLEIELAIYQQALESTKQGKINVLAANVKFSRPNDYFAEMVKTDEDMERIRSRLLKEHSSIEKSEQAKKQRELKKFGKKIQTEKLKERIDNKRDTLNKIDMIKKRKRGDNSQDAGGDEFRVDIGTDFDSSLSSSKKPRAKGKDSRKPAINKRRAGKDAKYGSGGVKRGKKRNTSESTSDISSFNGKRNKTSQSKKPRLGKSRRGKN